MNMKLTARYPKKKKRRESHRGCLHTHAVSLIRPIESGRFTNRMTRAIQTDGLFDVCFGQSTLVNNWPGTGTVGTNIGTRFPGPIRGRLTSSGPPPCLPRHFRTRAAVAEETSPFYFNSRCNSRSFVGAPPEQPFMGDELTKMTLNKGNTHYVLLRGQRRSRSDKLSGIEDFF